MATSMSLTIMPMTATFIPGNHLNPSPTIISDLPSMVSTGGNDGQSRSISYFFGFLIAVLAFLVFFVGCSIGARRGLLRRRRALDLENGGAFLPGAFGRNASRIPQREPVLWETSFEKGDSRWVSIKPLSVHAVPEEEDGPPPPYSIPMPNWLRPREPIPQNTILGWWMPRLPLIMRRLSHETTVSPPIPLNTVSASPSHSSPASSTANSSPTPTSLTVKPASSPTTIPAEQSAYQVVVMIAMPSQYHARDGSLGDLQFGVTKLPVTRDSSESL